MTDNQPMAATTEDLRQRCGHECLNQPDHDGPHFYGYRLGANSYEGLVRRVEELEAAVSSWSRALRQGSWDLSHGDLARRVNRIVEHMDAAVDDAR